MQNVLRDGRSGSMADYATLIRPTSAGDVNARLHLRDLRQPIYAVGRTAARLPDL